METYHIRLEGDTLRVGFGPDHANNDIIVQQVEQRLDHLIKTEQLAGGPLLKIDGPQSVPVCYAIAHRVAHLFGSVVRSAHQALTLIDVGGQLSPENRQIMREATHGVILYKQRQDLEEWRAFCQDLDLKIIAEILSDYEGTLDQIQSGSILKGSIHHLD